MQMNTREDSDRQLREAVLRQLEWVPQLTLYNIGVEATDGVVTLTGWVHTCAEKYAAQRTAHGVSGVHAVANEIEVGPASLRSDAELAREVMQAMKISVTAPEEIKVIVDGGFVTLEGTVESDFQRKSAESRTRNVAGIRGVVDHLTVKSRVSADQVSTKIEEALRHTAPA